LKPLVIFELANNHQGSLDHAMRIVDGLAGCKHRYESLFDFAVKFQFRNIETFIDPQADPGSNRHISRFRSNQLDELQWGKLTERARSHGFLVITTPFDEVSVDQAIRLQITTLKIASCSAQEWSLIDKAASVAQHLIVSTAGLDLDQIDALYSHLRHECRGDLTILHCVGIYPAPAEALNLATIRRFIQRYPKARIGYSGHEKPSDHYVSMTALAMGAQVFERHVGVSTAEIGPNDYSLDLGDVADWLETMSNALRMIGRPKASNYGNLEENNSRRALRRGVYATVEISSDCEIGFSLVHFRFPLRSDQIDVTQFTTIYNRFVSTQRIQAVEALTNVNTREYSPTRVQKTSIGMFSGSGE
jgi:sialic acid synthase SpsE